MSRVGSGSSVMGGPFPYGGLQPTKVTSAGSFVAKRPSSDGRGTVIAIFDSGVDPAAAGLQVTSTGETKVVERFDCSGCGDVDTSTSCRLKDGTLTGLTGRILRVPREWRNPTDVWKIGLFYPYTIFPKDLKQRIQNHRKEFLWDRRHRPAAAAASRELREFEAEHDSSVLSPEDKLSKEDLEARVEILNSLEKKFNDSGPAYDCVVFNDGSVWKACIDTSEEGSLESGVLLGEYGKTYEHKHLTDLDQMTVSINIHNDGNTLEVVGMCSSHGTHVAAIAAAHFPDEPEKNGVAPGAKIVSLTIGDGRLGTMETGTGIVRACIKVMELCSTMRIDVINMSYGEHAHWSNYSHIGDIMNEVVDKYGVCWIVSAANDGPALSTVAAPPDIPLQNLIGIGAYVSPEMMSAAYSMRAEIPGNAYTWSSRGPCADGALGVSVCAPGGAITTVPHYTLKSSQLMNGTSMAAPHVAGAACLLLSALKRDNLSYSPYNVKRALENSATFLTSVDIFAQGCGLLHVENAYKLLSTYHGEIERDVRFNVSCGIGSNKGIYLRDKLQERSRDCSVSIEPHFINDFTNPEGITENPKKIDFNMKLSLCCSASWIECPKYLDLTNCARNFVVRINPQSLPAGAHFTWIKAYDIKCVDKGPVFRIPVTIIQPEKSIGIFPDPHLSVESHVFEPGHIKRHFVMVPEYATWAVLKLYPLDKNVSARLMIHCMQLKTRMSCRTLEYKKFISMSTQAVVTLPFSVEGGLLLEVVISKFWASLDDSKLKYTLDFHGIKPESPEIVMHGGDGIHSVYLKALRYEECLPQVSLKHSVSVLRPVEFKLAPLTERDVIPTGRQIYELINTYNFHIPKATEVSLNASLLSDVLYESQYESQMWMLYDSNKQLRGCGDAYPSKYSYTLETGDYVVKLQIRHEKKDLLEKLNDMSMLLQQKLAQTIAMDIYTSFSQASIGGKKISSLPISSEFSSPVYITPLSNDKLGKNLTIGQYLLGNITFAKDELGKKVDSYVFKYIIPEPPKKSLSNNGKEKEKTKGDEFAKALRDFKTNWIPKLDAEQAQNVYEELVQASPEHLGSHTAYLQSLDPLTDLTKLPHPNQPPEITKTICEKIIAIADKVISAIDQEKLLTYFGMKSDTRSDAAKIRIQEEKQKSYLLEAFNKKGVALCKMFLLLKNDPDESKALLEQIKQLVSEALKLTEATDNKIIHFSLWHSIILEQWGRSLKLLDKIAEDRNVKEVEDAAVKLYSTLDWQHAVTFCASNSLTKYPTMYRPF